MKSFFAAALVVVACPSAFAAFDCHLARTTQQDSQAIFMSCNTGEEAYEKAEALCRELSQANGAETFYVNSYVPATTRCERN